VAGALSTLNTFASAKINPVARQKWQQEKVRCALDAPEWVCVCFPLGTGKGNAREESLYLTARGIGASCRVHYRPHSCSFWSLRPPLCGWRGCVCCLWTRSRFARWCPGAVYSCTTSPVSDIKRKSIIISAGKGEHYKAGWLPHQVYYENFYLAAARQAGCVLHMPFTHSLDPAQL
jgi:hypothetical protein